MNDTTNRKRLGMVALTNLQIMIRCVDDPKGMKLTKKLHAKAITDLARWDAMAVEEGWSSARDWVSAGPAPTDHSKVSPETLAARQRILEEMRKAGIKTSTQLAAERGFDAYPMGRR